MKQFRVTVNGEVFEVAVEEIGGSPLPAGQTPQLTLAPRLNSIPQPRVYPETGSSPSAPTGSGIKIKAPLPGTVLEIKAKVGMEVQEGDVVLILEAMKMENEVTASVSGQVKEILVDKGNAVNSGDILVIIS